MIKFIFASLLLFSISWGNNFASQPYHKPRRIEARFSFEMIIDQHDFDNKKDLKYWLPLPTESKRQKNVAIIAIQPKPTRIKKDTKNDLQIAYWNFAKAKDREKHTVTVEFKADVYQVDYFLDPEVVPDEYNKSSEVYRGYIKSDSLGFITPEIEELARELTRPVADPFLKVRNIYRWTIQHLEHQFPVSQRGTRFLFSHPIDAQQSQYAGDSAEYTWVLIAMCRAAGVPARSVTGFLAKPGWETPHTWVEFYLPKWGWLPADPYLADSKELLVEFSDQYDEYFYLGHLDNYHVTFYKGTNFRLEPKCTYSKKPFIFNRAAWYIPIGAWNFDKFSNASANLSVTFDALITNNYKNPRYGVELKFDDLWLQQSEKKLGPYIFKERFLAGDKSATLDFIGRKLRPAYKNLDAKKAASLEIKSLSRLNRSYQIISENPVPIEKIDAYEFIASFELDKEPLHEYRVYIVEKNYLFWMIGSAPENMFDQKIKLFQKLLKNMKLNIPDRRLQ